jgi:hypothetical protein
VSHPDEHVIVYEPNQRARAFELLLWQHKDKERIVAFVKALAAGAQLAENTSWAVIAGGSTVDAAEGATLERWGELVGERRGGLDHEQFRKFIGLRIRVNTEAPSENAVGAVLAEAVDPSVVSSYLVADGIVYQVTSAAFLDQALATHAGALVRDFRPAAIYAAVVEVLATDMFELGTVAAPGSILGTVASPGEVLGRLIYAGRG